MRRSYLVIALVMLSLVALMSGIVTADQSVSVEARVKPILTIDGLQFRDLNDNGVLDPYEDWRLDTEARIDDLLSQMTLEEKVGLLFHINTGGSFTPQYPSDDAYLEVNADLIDGFHVNNILDNNNGTPDYLANFHNQLQEIAEGTRLGVPIVFSCDRAWNTWGGMIDMPHAALGFAFANDPDLVSRILDAAAKEMAAIGYHVTLHPSGVELFGTWGEDVNLVTSLTTDWVSAYTSNNVDNCLKHFVSKPFGSSRSAAQLLDNYMQPWITGWDAGSTWSMITGGTGLSNANVATWYDEESIEYIRNELGFDGVLVTDWGCVQERRQSGVTADGVDLSSLTLEGLYKLMLDNGVDQFGAVTVMAGTDRSITQLYSNWPDAVLNLVNDGEITEARIDESARRILRTKYDLGLFDDPYVDPQTALVVAASTEYTASPWEISDTATLSAARNPRTLALDHALQAAATVLLKNDNGILPLEDGANVFVMGLSDEIIAREAAALAEYANIVDDSADADVVVVRVSPQGRRGAWDGSEMALVQAAVDAGLPTIVSVESSSATDLSAIFAQEKVAAVLMLTYTVGTDHGSPMGGTFVGSVTPELHAAMLFGRAEPTGNLPFELPRSAEQASEDWGDVPFDLGVTTTERLQIVAAINAGASVPINLGDPLFMYSYGLRYNLNPDFAYSTLVIPSTVGPGEAFTVSCLLTNDGFDGYTTAELAVDGQVVASKFMAVVGGQSRAVEFDVEVVLDEVGVHTVAIGPLVGEVEVVAPEEEGEG